MAEAELRVCERDGEPLVFTFEIPGCEYICMVCGNGEGIFGKRSPATTELQRRQVELAKQYRAERGLPDPVSHEQVRCISCGAVPEPGTSDGGRKPAAWFSRTIEGDTEYACSRSCIPEKQAVMPF